MIIIENDGREIVLADRHANYAPDVRDHFEKYFHAVGGHNGRVDFSSKKKHPYPEGLILETPSLPETWEDYCKFYTPTSTDLVFDCGAYAGYSTIKLAKVARSVVAFEPDPNTRECLKYNIESNGIENVTIVPAAIGGTSGRAEFFGEGSLGSRLNRPEYERGPFFTVRQFTLEECFSVFGTPAFIKMDIEGAEVEALKSSADLLARHRVHLAIDTHHRVPGGGWTYPIVESILRPYGYKVESSRESGYWTTWAEPNA